MHIAARTTPISKRSCAIRYFLDRINRTLRILYSEKMVRRGRTLYCHSALDAESRILDSRLRGSDNTKRLCQSAPLRPDRFLSGPPTVANLNAAQRQRIAVPAPRFWGLPRAVGAIAAKTLYQRIAVRLRLTCSCGGGFMRVRSGLRCRGRRSSGNEFRHWRACRRRQWRWTLRIAFPTRQGGCVVG